MRAATSVMLNLPPGTSTSMPSSPERITPCSRHCSQRAASDASGSTSAPPSAVVRFLLAKAEGHEIAEAADGAAPPARTERLRRVLDHAHAMLAGDGIKAIAVDGQARQVHRDDRLGFLRDRLFGQGEVEFARARTHIPKNRSCAALERPIGRRGRRTTGFRG